MREFSTSLFKWFAERTKCLQIAVTRLLGESVHSDRTILDLTSLWLQEAGENKPRSVMK